MKIRDMTVGQQGRVQGISGEDREYREKLLRMGLVKGTPFTILRKAPLGDPLEIEVRGFNLTLRRDEGAALEVEFLPAADGEDGEEA